MRKLSVTGMLFVAGLATAVGAMGCVADDGSVGNDGDEIVGGHNTTIDAHPWQVALTTNGAFQFCGGSILSPSWVISAQHCVFGGDADMRVVAGITRISQQATGQIRAIDAIATFPGYVDASVGKDISLLHLSTPLDLSGANARAITIVTAADAAAGATNGGVTSTVTGWGTLSSGGSSPDILQEVAIPLVTNAQAQAAYPAETITADQLGAGIIGTGGVDSCQGDSGGPLTVVVGGVTKLGGTVSWGYGCADKRYPGMYGRVSSFDTWIASRIAGTVTVAINLTGLAAAKNTFTDRTVTVLAGTQTLSVWMTSGTGDADLYVRQGSAPTLTTYNCRPYLTGNYEFCTFDNPAAGTWHVAMNAYAAYSGASLKVALNAPGGPTPENCTDGIDNDLDGQTDCADSDCASAPTCLPPVENCTNGVDDDGDSAIDCADSDCASAPSCSTGTPTTFTDTSSVGNNSWKHYPAFSVKAGTTFTAFMDRLQRNPDLYVRWGAQPTTTQWTCRPFLSGSPGDETCTLTVPAGTTQAFVSIRGHQNGSNSYALTVNYTKP